MARKKRSAAAPVIPSAPVAHVMRWLSVVLLVTVLAYLPAMKAPYAFDDIAAIPENASIRQLWPVSVPLAPPSNTAVSGRPVVNYSLALNNWLNDQLGVDQRPYPAGPNKTFGFHVVNLALHLATGVMLFLILRRTLRRQGYDEGVAERAEPLALLVTALWLLHPIQTEAVNYLVQRTELLASLCYLVVLYSAIRAWDAIRPRDVNRWYALAVIACLVGMECKEVVFTAPLVVACYDRAFRQTSWKGLVAGKRAWFYALLVLAAVAPLVAGVRGNARFDTVGFHAGITWYQYLYSQAWAIGHYLRLLLWPDQLSFDYGKDPVRGLVGIPAFIALGLLAVATLVAWTRVDKWGWAAFLGAWFFLILAPSSSVVPIATEIAAERRIYLAAAGVLLFGVLVLEKCVSRLAELPVRLRRKTHVIAVASCGLVFFVLSAWEANQLAADRLPLRIAIQFGVSAAAVFVAWLVLNGRTRRWALVLICGALAFATFERSASYADTEGLWRDAVRKHPGNPRAHLSLAAALVARESPDFATAEVHYREAISLDSTYLEAWNGLAIVAIDQSQPVVAESLLTHVLAADSGNAEATGLMGRMLLRRGDVTRALPYLERSAAAFPTDNSLVALGTASLAVGKFDLGVAALREALRINPSRTDAMRLLGGLLAEQGHPNDALPLLQQAVSGDPESPLNRALLSLALAQSGRVAESVDAANGALARGKGIPRVLILVGRAMLVAGRLGDAQSTFAEAVRISPDNQEARSWLAKSSATGR